MVLLIKMGIRLQRKKTAFSMCGRNSAVECQLPKLDVVGSSPIARSNKMRGLRKFSSPFFLFYGIIIPTLYPTLRTNMEG
jgi:hypothetical protein